MSEKEFLMLNFDEDGSRGAGLQVVQHGDANEALYTIYLFRNDGTIKTETSIKISREEMVGINKLIGARLEKELTMGGIES